MILNSIDKIVTKIRRKTCLFLLLVWILIVPLSKIAAQEAHFSQYYAGSLFVNPAQTGQSEGKFRFANIYRNQWSKIGVPYKTLYSSLDAKVRLAGKEIGIGGMILHDQSSVYNLTTDEFLFSLSYATMIHQHQIVLGIQPGYAYKAYNPNGITYGNQFDPSGQNYNSSLPSSENDLSSKASYFDLNVGLFWRTFIKNIMPSAGIAIQHLNTPVASFSNSSTGYRMPMKLTCFSRVNIPVDTRFNLEPGIYYSFTAHTNELVVGGLEAYNLNNSLFSVKQVYVVTMVRINPFKNMDACILGGGIRFSHFDAGITYDYTVSSLSQTAKYNGAFEISLVYTGGKKYGRLKSEPCIIY